MSDDKYAPPKPSKGDVGHSLAKAALSAVPVVGGSAAELFQLLIQPSLEKRRAAWMEGVADGLKKLEEEGLKLDDLKDNEEFTSAVMQASQIAMRTHQQTKLDALRNAVLNVAAGQAPEDALQAMFLNFVDTFTEWHLAILKLFQAPPEQKGMMAGGLSHVLETAFPDLRGRREFYDTIWRDLFQRGLVNTETLHAMMSGSGLTQKRTTPHGDQFLAFIAEPQS
ncbi:MAG TPA: hypothetical protein VMR17_06460 [Xanthobacteraceae bacterium]|jgi:hypothetical protein|nr:hypothetical protein [Xanthobacteraceae bacterium]